MYSVNCIHFPYYNISIKFHNTYLIKTYLFFFPPAIFALSFWLVQRYGPFTWLAGFGIIVFRSELCMFFGNILLMDLHLRKVRLKQILFHAILAGVFWLSKFLKICTRKSYSTGSFYSNALKDL